MKFFKNKNKEKINNQFTIEYYPEGNKYYSKYKNYYLKKDWKTGIVKLENGLIWAEYFFRLKDAENIIKLYKEQRFKKNVVIINYMEK